MAEEHPIGKKLAAYNDRTLLERARVIGTKRDINPYHQALINELARRLKDALKDTEAGPGDAGGGSG